MAFNYQAIINSVNNFAAKYGLTVYAYTPNFKGIVDAIDNLQNIQFTVEDGTIVNADVNVNAAIAGTKIAPDFGSQTIETTGIFSAGTGAAATPSITFTGDTNTGIYSLGSDQLAISTNGTAAVTVDASQRVGIGASNPVEPLCVRSTTGGNIYLQAENTNTGSGSSIFFKTSTFLSSSSGSHAVISGIRTDVLNGYLTFETRGGGFTTERMRIDSSGNVGIGTSSGDARLTVNSSGSQAFEVENSDSSDSKTLTINQGNANHGSSATVLDIGASNATSIITTGNVGIGTTSPDTRLTIAKNSNANFTSNSTLRSSALATFENTEATTAIVLKGDTTNPDKFIFADNKGGTQSFGLGHMQGGVRTNSIQCQQTGNIIFNRQGSETARFDSSGNVGIGATDTLGNKVFIDGGNVRIDGAASTNATLQIRGDNSTSSATDAVLSFVSYLNNTAQGSNGDITVTNQGSGYGQMVFSTRRGSGANTEAMRIDSLGNVGIGTSSPQAISGYTVLTLNNATQGGAIEFKKNGTSYGRLLQGSSAVILETKQSIPLLFNTNDTERMRIDDAGRVYIGHTSTELYNQTSQTGVFMGGTGFLQLARTSDQMLLLNRLASDGRLAGFYQAAVLEGDITVSGTTVSYNGAHLSRWSQLASGTERIEILRGSVLSNLDEMCEWGDEDNEQLNRMKVSDVEGDRNVSGVFQCWDDDDDTYTNDFYCAMTGDFVIRIAQGTTVARGDLLMSAGDGTAKPQDDDIVRSKTIAKVTSTTVSESYSDGSYCVPCVLMAC